MNAESRPSFDLRANTFLKSVVIKNGLAEFTHRSGTNAGDYRLTCAAFKDLEGKTVLINSAMEVFRSDRKIGDAKPAQAGASTAPEPDLD